MWGPQSLGFSDETRVTQISTMASSRLYLLCFGCSILLFQVACEESVKSWGEGNPTENNQDQKEMVRKATKFGTRHFLSRTTQGVAALACCNKRRNASFDIKDRMWLW